MCAGKNLYGSCLPDSPSYWEQNKLLFPPHPLSATDTTWARRRERAPLLQPRIRPPPSGPLPAGQPQDSLDEGTVIARAPSHPWPCPALGTSHHTAPGEPGRSLSPLQIG